MKTYLLLLTLSTVTLAQEVINNSSIAFTVPEKDWLTESLAFDAKTGDFYFSSTRQGKIFKLTSRGKVTEFASTEDGLWMTIGIKVDMGRRQLWVCSSGGGNLIGYDRKDERPAGVFKFDLESGELLWKHIVDVPGETHFFNDVVVAKNGDAYVTHMFSDPGIYKYDSKTEELALFSKPDTLSFPNGLTLSNDEKYLFVAHSGGIGRIDIKSGKWVDLAASESIGGVDGLYFYKNSLVGVLSRPKQVKQFVLNSDQSAVSEIKILEKNHPMMNRPTTGVLVEDDFYYVANAQFDSFNEDGSLFPLEKLFELVILKINLKDQ